MKLKTAWSQARLNKIRYEKKAKRAGEKQISGFLLPQHNSGSGFRNFQNQSAGRGNFLRVKKGMFPVQDI
jgi:hypothetical protein